MAYSLTFLALGDSYTIGEGVKNEDSFPFQTAGLLRKKGITVNDPVIIARTGWTTADLINAIEEKNIRRNFGIVTLLIGVNNQYQNKPVDQYREQFRQLLKTAISFANGEYQRVFVLSIPDYSVTPFAAEKDPQKITREIVNYNDINKAITDELGAHYVNIFIDSLLAGSDPEMIAQDGLHPSRKQYALWSVRLAEAIQNAFEGF